MKQTTTAVFAVERRSLGTFPSLPHAVPLTAIGDLWIQLEMPSRSELEDNRNGVQVIIYVLMDGTWKRGPSMAWTGTRTPLPLGSRAQAPLFSAPVVDPFGLYDMRGTSVRIELEVQRPMRVGASVTSLTLF